LLDLQVTAQVRLPACGSDRMDGIFLRLQDEILRFGEHFPDGNVIQYANGTFNFSQSTQHF
jgi:hypothetical protein